ncbi:MAG: hypothetical protein MJZ33_11720 [Paludibacteraceae bacterium]|nr:hypothetical protein [Paludibacteraceae bacterium]
MVRIDFEDAFSKMWSDAYKGIRELLEMNNADECCLDNCRIKKVCLIDRRLYFLNPSNELLASEEFEDEFMYEVYRSIYDVMG